MLPDCGQGQPVAGERYLKPVRPGRFPEGGGEVHEITRLLSTTLLHQTLVYHENGAWQAVNAKLEKTRGGYKIIPASGLIRQVYLNTAGAAPLPRFSLASTGKVELVRHPRV